MFTELYEVVAVQKTTLIDCSNHVGQFFLAKKSNFTDFGSYRRLWAHCAYSMNFFDVSEKSTGKKTYQCTVGPEAPITPEIREI